MNIPEAKYPFRHVTPVQIRFNDIDMFGHLNNTVYFEYADLAKMLYFNQFTDGRFTPDNIGLVVANVNATFYHPTHIDDTVTVLTAVLSIGESSLALEQRIVDDTGQVKCIVSTIMVSFDPNTEKSAPVTDEWRSKISTYEGRNL